MNARLTSLLTLSLCLGTSLLAQTAAPAPAPASAAPESSWVLTGSVVSQYMFRGVRLGGPCWQPSAEFDSGNLALGIWSSLPTKDKVAGQSDPEIDPYGSYKIIFNDTFSVQPGFTFYNYPSADRDLGFYKYSFEPNIAVNVTVAGVTLSPKYYYDIVLHGPTYELNAAYALPLKNIGSELDFTGTIGTYMWKEAYENSSPATKNWGDYWSAGVAMPFQVTKSSKLTVGWAYTRGSNNYVKQGSYPKILSSFASARGVLTISYAVTF